MGKKKLDWGNLPFGYMKTTKSFVANWKNGEWDEGKLTKNHSIKMTECAGVLQYAQTCFEGLKAYTTENGDIVTFRPDLNADRMEASCKRLEMPVFPKERFIEAVLKTIVLKEYLAVVFGHEYDHLNGILFVDRVNKENVDEFIIEFENYTKKGENFNYDELGNYGKIIYDMLKKIKSEI